MAEWTSEELKQQGSVALSTSLSIISRHLICSPLNFSHKRSLFQFVVYHCLPKMNFDQLVKQYFFYLSIVDSSVRLFEYSSVMLDL